MSVLFPLQASVCYLFGGTDGTAAELLEGVEKLCLGQQILCSFCDRDLASEAHKPGCKILAGYDEVVLAAAPTVQAIKSATLQKHYGANL